MRGMLHRSIFRCNAEIALTPAGSNPQFGIGAMQFAKGCRGANAFKSCNKKSDAG
ncbi:hypothetical protein SAMN04488523_111152 [Sulfitobacter brevis]|uniref:Uncharacterized protein n=1 Tax=Sulfitobacter brevis TaxID=74348 RepID=A0A1I2E8J2_9RHOB|nr:hypothetical protein SAMN04488523_111152 [Sulfitobacter brevis]